MPDAEEVWLGVHVPPFPRPALSAVVGPPLTPAPKARTRPDLARSMLSCARARASTHRVLPPGACASICACAPPWQSWLLQLNPLERGRRSPLSGWSRVSSAAHRPHAASRTPPARDFCAHLSFPPGRTQGLCSTSHRSLPRTLPISPAPWSHHNPPLPQAQPNPASWQPRRP